MLFYKSKNKSDLMNDTAALISIRIYFATTAFTKHGIRVVPFL